LADLSRLVDDFGRFVVIYGGLERRFDGICGGNVVFGAVICWHFDGLMWLFGCLLPWVL